MKLYTYFRSSTSYRVRIALALKGLEYESIPISLIKNEHHEPAYLKVNPMGGVPALEHEGTVIGQSLAIIEYLESVKASPSLFPGSAADQAFARQVALAIATDIHPLINLKVGKYLGEMGVDESARKDWTAHWSLKGMKAVEAMLASRGGPRGTAVVAGLSVADICIIPQMYSLRRNGIDLSDLPICCAIEKHCTALPEFRKAAPETQADAPADLEVIHGPQAQL
ncbi:MAG TPA: maleylacetoacetate isomerase [Alphaproteobacteria bacterium]|nr:maleylacetoacetate isomerase [Alphaproteobacteria bacterium]